MLPLLTQSLLSHSSSTYDIIVVGEAVMCTNSNNLRFIHSATAATGTATATVVVALLLFDSEKRAISGGWLIQNATEVLHLDCVLVCSLHGAFIHRELVRCHDEWVAFNVREIVRWCDEVISIDFLYFLKIYAL